MIALNKTIAYTKHWKHTLWIALLLGAILPLLLITLEPFDTSNSFAYKYVRLAGYALCLIIPVLLVHPFENYIYRKQANRWFILNEFFYIGITIFIIFVFCFFYHFYVVSGLTTLHAASIWGFMSYYGLPFTPIVIPVWLYLRSKYGVIEVPIHNAEKIKSAKTVTVHGENKTETLSMRESDFIYAQAQQNYVDLYYSTSEGIQQKMFRSTLSNMMIQLPNAWQVHRSYLVNLDYLKTVEGNARKRYIRISNIEETIPISQKYYEALTKRLSNSSQTAQN